MSILTGTKNVILACVLTCVDVLLYVAVFAVFALLVALVAYLLDVSWYQAAGFVAIAKFSADFYESKKKYAREIESTIKKDITGA